MKDESGRKYIYIGIFTFVAIAFIFKLLQLQVINTDDNRRFSDAYSIKRIVRFPARGNILDRNGKILVGNDYAYDIYMTPNEAKPIETIDFCMLSDITIKEFVKVSRNAW